jgi:hypothetical protein
MPLELCRHLMWKSISRDLDDPGAVAAQFARNSVPYTCQQTCRNAGPDDELVAPELCHAERGCYDPSPLSLRLASQADAEER